MVLDRVLHQFRVVSQSHLLKEAGAVRGHRFYADVQLRGDVARRLAGGDQAKDLELAAGETLMRSLLRRPHCVEGQKLRERGREEPLAAGDVADRGHEIFARAALADVAEGAAAEGARRV